MIKQYPHFLFVKTVVESTRDNDGNWIAGSVNWQLHSVCREETNGKGSMINGSDGKAIVFLSTVYMPKAAASIAEGTEVKVCTSNDGNGSVRVSGVVLKCDVSQLNCRLWV